MADKTLSIAIKVVDRATAPIRRIGAVVGRVTRRAVRAAAKVDLRLGKMLRAVTGLKTVLAGLAAAAGLAVFVQQLNAAAREIDTLAKNAKRLGVTVEEFQGLAFAADQSGSSMEAVTTGVRTALRNLVDFKERGIGPARDALRTLGVDLSELTDASGDLVAAPELLARIADQIVAVEDQATRVNVVQLLFGRGGVDLLPLLQQGGDALRDYVAEVERLGGVSGEAARISERLVDSQSRLRLAYLGVRSELLELVGPGLTEGFNRLAAFTARVGNVIDTIGEGLRSEELRDDALFVVADLTVRIADAGFEMGAQLVIRLGEGAIAALPALGRILASGLAQTLGKSIINAVGSGVAAAQDGIAAMLSALASVTDNNPVAFQYRQALNEASAFFSDLAGLTRQGVDEVNEQLGIGGSLREQFNRDARESLTEFAAGQAGLITDLQEMIAFFGENLQPSLDAVDRLAAKLAKLRQEIAGQGGTGGSGTEAEGTLFGRFVDGVNAATQGVVNLGDVVANVAQAGTQAFAAGLTRALFDFASGAKSAKQAFGEFAASFLRLIAEMIVQALILRAIAGVFGGAAANMGGTVNRSGGISRFNSGTSFVPGPNVNRDIVPALLTPGEAVLNRTATRANSRGTIAFMNSGGTVEPAGSGGGRGGGGMIRIEQNFTLSGGRGARSDEAFYREVEKATQRGVLAGLSRNPSFREQVRKRLAG